MMGRILFFLLLLSHSLVAKPLVVSSFSILNDMVHEIGQDQIELKTLVGPNQDAHVYEPRPQNAKDLSEASLVIINGLGFEGWFERLIAASGFKGKVVAATQGIHPLTFDTGTYILPDPHAWHSLKNAQVYVDNIVKALSELVPEEASTFKARGDTYKAKLKALKEKTNRDLASIPVEKRKVITNHNAFNYLGRDFDISFVAPLGISTDAEPSAKSVAKLINLINTQHIRALFTENTSNPRLMEQISRETGVHIGGVLYSDALSAPGTSADTYLKMMEHNLSSLVKALSEEK